MPLAPRTVALAGLLLLLLAAAGVHWLRRRSRRRRREPYVQAIVGGAALVASIAAPFIGKLINKKKKKAPEPTYRGRQQDGYDWSCPEGTVETGAVEDAKACITSEFHPPVWKAGPDGKTWDHLCPNGTVPAPEGDWNRKCVVGWTTRVQSGNAWVCPNETTDTGKTWTDPSWHEGHKQCKRSKPYTQRVQTADGKGWVCPPGTKDTGKSWEDPVHGAKQCKWTGP